MNKLKALVHLMASRQLIKVMKGSLRSLRSDNSLKEGLPVVVLPSTAKVSIWSSV